MFNLHKCVDLGFANKRLFSNVSCYAPPQNLSQAFFAVKRDNSADFSVTLGKSLTSPFWASLPLSLKWGQQYLRCEIVTGEKKMVTLDVQSL